MVFWLACRPERWDRISRTMINSRRDLYKHFAAQVCFVTSPERISNITGGTLWKPNCCNAPAPPHLALCVLACTLLPIETRRRFDHALDDSSDSTGLVAYWFDRAHRRRLHSPASS